MRQRRDLARGKSESRGSSFGTRPRRARHDVVGRCGQTNRAIIHVSVGLASLEDLTRQRRDLARGKSESRGSSCGTRPRRARHDLVGRCGQTNRAIVHVSVGLASWEDLTRQRRDLARGKSESRGSSCGTRPRRARHDVVGRCGQTNRAIVHVSVGLGSWEDLTRQRRDLARGKSESRGSSCGTRPRRARHDVVVRWGQTNRAIVHFSVGLASWEDLTRQRRDLARGKSESHGSSCGTRPRRARHDLVGRCGQTNRAIVHVSVGLGSWEDLTRQRRDLARGKSESRGSSCGTRPRRARHDLVGRCGQTNRAIVHVSVGLGSWEDLTRQTRDLARGKSESRGSSCGTRPRRGAEGGWPWSPL